MHKLVCAVGGTPGAVTCQGQNTSCALSAYSSEVQFPENIYARLSEYTFGDAIIPEGQKPLLKPDHVGYNISYVDHVYLPIGIGPKNNPYIGYSGSVQPLPTFANALDTDKQAAQAAKLSSTETKPPTPQAPCRSTWVSGPWLRNSSMPVCR